MADPSKKKRQQANTIPQTETHLPLRTLKKTNTQKHTPTHTHAFLLTRIPQHSLFFSHSIPHSPRQSRVNIRAQHLDIVPQREPAQWQRGLLQIRLRNPNTYTQKHTHTHRQTHISHNNKHARTVYGVRVASEDGGGHAYTLAQILQAHTHARKQRHMFTHTRINTNTYGNPSKLDTTGFQTTTQWQIQARKRDSQADGGREGVCGASVTANVQMFVLLPLSVCVSVCVLVCACVYAYGFMCMCARVLLLGLFVCAIVGVGVFVRKSESACVSLYVCLYKSVFVGVCTRTYVCVCVRVCVCVSVSTNIHLDVRVAPATRRP
jgi:hypothetical protein